MRTVVPFGAADPKTRLRDALDADGRAGLAAAMLADVLETVRAAGGEPEVLADASLDDLGAAAGASPDVVPDPDAPVTVDDRPLTDCVNAALRDALGDGGTVAVVMADLALATPAAVERLYRAGRAADVALAPGRGGGTNALVASHPDFRVDYHGASYHDHRELAEAAGATVREVDSFRLATDVDEPADLAEVLLHADGRAAAWLRDRGFELAVEDGRVGVRRP